MSEDEDEFDNMPDDFADIQGVDWAQILAGPSGSNPASTEEQHPDLPRTASEDIPLAIPAHLADSHPSTDYFEDDYDNLDPSLLAELDRIEGELTDPPQRPRFMAGGIPTTTAVVPQLQSQSTSDLQPSHYFSILNTHPQTKRKDMAADSQSGKETPSVFFKKQRLDDASCLTSLQGKGKMKANDDVLQQILSAYEDEITCPICCDFYVFTHVSNPCGHSFCGSCGREWHMKNKSCPVCRTHLEKVSPMIPNITIDNVVEKHIQALALSGDQDWETGGCKAEEWYKRKQTWRNNAIDREKMKPPATHRTRAFIPSVIDLTGAIHAFNRQPNWFRIEDDLETYPTYEDTSDMELIPRPIRRARQRRRVAGPTVVNLE